MEQRQNQRDRNGTNGTAMEPTEQRDGINGTAMGLTESQRNYDETAAKPT